MTDLYFLRIFFIDKIIPYTMMTISITYLLLEMMAPRELRFVFYDFSDRLFFKFIYRPAKNMASLSKNLIIFNLRKIQGALHLREKLKRKREVKKEKRLLNKEQKAEKKLIIKTQKREAKLIEKTSKRNDKSFKREKKLQSKLDNKKLRGEVFYKLKVLVAYKLKMIINRNQPK